MFLAAWLRKHPMTNKALAGHLGLSEEAARLYRAGRRRPSAMWTVKRIYALTQGMVTNADLHAAYEQRQKRKHPYE